MPPLEPAIPSKRRAAYTAFGLTAECAPLAQGLYVVATPIGNLRDITLRALETLAAADAVIAEDTRVAKTLLAHYGMTTPLIAYHEHNAHVMRPHILARLEAGAAMALISDAGTPLVSDPGYKLVTEAIAAGVFVTAAPGPSAVLAALVVGGISTNRFYFEGFLPPKGAARRARLSEIATIPGTLVFFESPRRTIDMLADCAAVLGNRPAALARELTKRFETVRRGLLPDLAAELASDSEALRGEIVILVGPPNDQNAAWSDSDIEERLRAALAGHSVKDAAAIVSGETGQPRRAVYARALQISRDGLSFSQHRNEGDGKDEATPHKAAAHKAAHDE